MLERDQNRTLVDEIKAKYGEIPTSIKYGELCAFLGLAVEDLTPVGEEILSAAQTLAEASKRKRSLILLHNDFSEKTHRMINTLTAGTYPRPHKHTDLNTSENFSALTGTAVAIEFSEIGEIVKAVAFGDGVKTKLVDVRPGVIHTVLPLTKVFTAFEVKGQESYTPDTDKVFAPWAPKESDFFNKRKYLASLYIRLAEKGINTDGVDMA